jgi:hypothetical protein
MITLLVKPLTVVAVLAEAWAAFFGPGWATYASAVIALVLLAIIFFTDHDVEVPVR